MASCNTRYPIILELDEGEFALMIAGLYELYGRYIETNNLVAMDDVTYLLADLGETD